MFAGVAIAVLLLGCSDGSSASSTSSAVLPASVVDNGTTAANDLIGALKGSGIPIGRTFAHPASDAIFAERDGLIAKVDFQDERLLSTNRSIDDDVNGGSVEVFRDERSAVGAARDRCGYVYVSGLFLVHLAAELAPDWVIGYRNAVDASAGSITFRAPPTDLTPKQPAATATSSACSAP